MVPGSMFDGWLLSCLLRVPAAHHLHTRHSTSQIHTLRQAGLVVRTGS